jgi:hypothetical protein
MKKPIKIDETNGSLALNLIPAMLYVQKIGEKFNGVTNHLGLVVSSCRCVVLSSGVVAFCSNMVLPCNRFFVFVSKKNQVP